MKLRWKVNLKANLALKTNIFDICLLVMIYKQLCFAGDNPSGSKDTRATEAQGRLNRDHLDVTQ